MFFRGITLLYFGVKSKLFLMSGDVIPTCGEMESHNIWFPEGLHLRHCFNGIYQQRLTAFHPGKLRWNLLVNIYCN